MTREEIAQKKIAVLMGGLSAEREVSLRTGAAVLKALREANLDAVGIDAGRDLPQQLRDAGAEVAFIALHGRFGEDGTVQGLLELLSIPYTGSGVRASSVAMDKITSKRLLLQAGIGTPDFAVLEAQDDLGVSITGGNYPKVVKPACEGSTIGITIARTAQELQQGVEAARQCDARVLVEAFVAGMEVTVGVLDGQALPIIQVVPKGGFYDYTAKYTAGQTEYILPAPLSPELTAELQRQAVVAAAALGCCGAVRVDFIVSDNQPQCLEVNTIPGMTETSLLPKAARYAGMSFRDLALSILAGAGLNK